MKVEFNGNGFSASIGGDDKDLAREEGNGLLDYFKREKALALGLIALFTALLSLPFGIYIELSLNLVNSVSQSSINSWTTVLLVLSISIAVASIALAVTTTFLFIKQKTKNGKYGVAASCVAFGVAVFCLILNLINLLQ